MDPKKEFLQKFMRLAIQNSSANIPHPMCLIIDKAKKRLEKDDLIQFMNLIKLWEKFSPKGKKEVSKLLVLNSFDLVDTIEVGLQLNRELREMPEFISEHPEYARKMNDGDLMSGLSELFD